MKCLLDIGETQWNSLQEGVRPLVGGQLLTPLTRYKRWSDRFAIDNIVLDADPRDRFMVLCDSLNAKRGYSWESNPWVWVIEFVQLKTKGQTK